MTIALSREQANELILAIRARSRATGSGTHNYRLCKEIEEIVKLAMDEETAGSNGKIAGVDSSGFKEY